MFKPRADFGNLHATKSKMHEKSPDYFGEVAIDPKDLTNVRVEDGLHIYKLGGWKLQAKSGKTYLSLKGWYPTSSLLKPSPRLQR